MAGLAVMVVMVLRGWAVSGRPAGPVVTAVPRGPVVRPAAVVAGVRRVMRVWAVMAVRVVMVGPGMWRPPRAGRVLPVVLVVPVATAVLRAAVAPTVMVVWVGTAGPVAPAVMVLRGWAVSGRRAGRVVTAVPRVWAV